jgi:DNA-directed RNA polymerase specialized sigma24 family protein
MNGGDEEEPGPWARLPRGHRVALALASLGGCSLDEVAAIVAADRRHVARALRDALCTVKAPRVDGAMP